MVNILVEVYLAEQRQKKQIKLQGGCGEDSIWSGKAQVSMGTNCKQDYLVDESMQTVREWEHKQKYIYERW